MELRLDQTIEDGGLLELTSQDEEMSLTEVRFHHMHLCVSQLRDER